MDSSVAVVSVVNNTTNNRHPSLSCNALGGAGGSVVFVSGGGGLGVGLGGGVGGVAAENKGIVNGPVATNSSNSCLEVVVGVEGLDLLASAQEQHQHQQQPQQQQQLLTTLSTDALTAPIVKGNLVNPRQLNQSTTAATILLNPLAITGSVAANNNTNCNSSNNTNLNDLMQLTGVTPSTTTTITTVKIEPSSVLVQQQQSVPLVPVAAQLQHPVGNPAQQSAMTNKRNRMEV